jgi:hypothetical protein
MLGEQRVFSNRGKCGCGSGGSPQVESTVRYLGIDAEDALTLAELTEVSSRAVRG